MDSSLYGVGSGHPNTTLYVNNLNERVPIKHLKQTLKEIFSEYGQVLDVVAKRRLALRGQAFILFSDVSTANRALIALQGERIYGNSMNIRFARYKSDWLSNQDGTFEIERKRREQDRAEKSRLPKMTRRQMLAQLAANPVTIPMPMMGGMPPGMGMSASMPNMMMMMSMPTSSPPTTTSGIPSDTMTLFLPNKLLYLHPLPEGVTESQLEETFKRFSGFLEVRMVPMRPDVAFIDFETESQAAIARQATDGMEVSNLEGMRVQLKVAFARK